MDDDDGAGHGHDAGSAVTRARAAATKGQYVQMNNEEEEGETRSGAPSGAASSSGSSMQPSSTGLELSSLRAGGGMSSGGGGGGVSRVRGVGRSGDSLDGGLSGSLISSEHPSEAIHLSQRNMEVTAAAVAPAGSAAARIDGLLGAGRQTLEEMSQRLRLMLMEDALETAEEEIEMMDYVSTHANTHNRIRLAARWQVWPAQ